MDMVPLVSSRGRGISATWLYCALAILRLLSYFLSLVVYCTYEPSAGGYSGCQENPPTLSTTSSYNGAHGGIRAAVCITVCVPMVLVCWLVLRSAYCDLVDAPPYPKTFSVLLAMHCVLDVAQLVTAHSTEHWVIAHLFFAQMCITMVVFYHGVLTSPGSLAAAPMLMALMLFLSSIGLLIFLIVSFKFDTNDKLQNIHWVGAEYASIAFVILMHLFIGMALPLRMEIRFPNDTIGWPRVVMRSDTPKSSPKSPDMCDQLEAGVNTDTSTAKSRSSRRKGATRRGPAPRSNRSDRYGAINESTGAPADDGADSDAEGGLEESRESAAVSAR